MAKHLLKYSSETNLILGCKNQERDAQYAVYQLYAGKMLAVCKRYLGNGPEAEDTLMEGFMKVFTKIDAFQEQGSFEGWIRRISVNACLNAIKESSNEPS